MVMKSFRYLLLFLLTIFLAGCRHPAPPPPPAPVSFEEFLVQVQQERVGLREKDLSAARKYLFTLVNDRIPEYWVGTAWDFNGTTRKPKEGWISCGYFVTNTLTDLGFPIERVQLAQAPSSELVHAVCTDVKWYSGFDNLLKYMNAAPSRSVHLVGLDAHTGYLTREKNKSYFIHANWRGVNKEWVDTCMALKESKIFVVGSLTANDAMLQRWVSN